MNNRIFAIILTVASLVSAPCLPLPAIGNEATAQTSRPARKKGKAAKTSSRRTAGKRPAASTSKKKTQTNAPARKETSADVRRREEATRREIVLTQEQIRENDLAVKRGLNDLGKLQTDIEAGKKKLAAATQQVHTVDNKINGLSSSIASGEKELVRLRAEYLKAVKKMRLHRKQTSELAFIFASKDFNEALRRMRYLKQFADWRDKQTVRITGQVKQLKYEKELLAQTRVEKQRAVQTEATAQASLQKQYTEQDAVVARLKENGSALRTHLGKKQQEANQLRGRISALIAEEQRRAEAERREREAREAAARRAEEERLARLEAERKAREEAEKEKERELAAATAAGDKATAIEPEKPAQQPRKVAAKAEKPKAEKPVVRKTKAEKPKAEKPKKVKKPKQPKERKRKPKEKQAPAASVNNNSNVSGNDYAHARRRPPRGKAPSASEGGNVPSTKKRNNSNSAASGGDFASMRGSLPRPVSGAFKITSPFGVHPVPGIPDVKYDNPGIDAEVSAGASAQAVYGGKVSGVYVVPGYYTVVIVSHGSYYTVYGNIQSPGVKVGDTVRQGQSLGKLAPAEEDPSHSSIHFEVWHNRDKQNPAAWIR